MINIIKQLYKKRFHRIYLFMPETSRKSLKNYIFEKNLDPEQIFEELNDGNITNLLQILKANSKKI